MLSSLISDPSSFSLLPSLAQQLVPEGANVLFYLGRGRGWGIRSSFRFAETNIVPREAHP